MNDIKFTDKDFEEMTSSTKAQAWVRKIDREHCAVTLGDDDLDSPAVQTRVTAMGAARRAVEFFGRDARNILNENSAVQILFCIVYLANLKK